MSPAKSLMPSQFMSCFTGNPRPMKAVCGWVLWGSLILGACVPSVEPPPLPTTTLIPATPIFTPLPPTPPSSPAPSSGLVLPADLSTGQRVATDVESASRVAQALSMIDYASRTWGGSIDQFTVLEFSRVIWYSADLGCGGSTRDFVTPVPIEGFRIVLRAAAQTYILHQANGGNPKRCEDQQPLRGEKYGLVLNDPVAEEFIELAKAQLRDELPPSAIIELEELRAYTWSDSSLGCPLPNQRYSEGEYVGYRIVLRVNTQRALFHTTFDSLIRCEAEYETLPNETDAGV